MASPFLGEIKMVSFNYPPKGWAFCNGQIMSLQQNQALFALLGTTYGGNGQNTFGLPNMQGRVAMHLGGNLGLVIGQVGGEQTHTLLTTEMPAHSHQAQSGGTGVATALSTGNVPGQSSQPFYSPNATTTLTPSGMGTTGGSQPHNNMAPYLVISFVIALAGIFPSRN
jgi:microcystin-dependent protein